MAEAFIPFSMPEFLGFLGAVPDPIYEFETNIPPTKANIKSDGSAAAITGKASFAGLIPKSSTAEIRSVATASLFIVKPADVSVKVVKTGVSFLREKTRSRGARVTTTVTKAPQSHFHTRSFASSSTLVGRVSSSSLIQRMTRSEIVPPPSTFANMKPYSTEAKYY